MSFIINQTLIYAVPLMLGALAGIFAERCGIINLALDGTMITGAFAGVAFIKIMQQTALFSRENAQYLLIVTMLVCAAAGVLFSFLLSFAAVRLQANQTIGGTALNMLAPGSVIFLSTLIFNQSTLSMSEGDAAGWFMIGNSSDYFKTSKEYNFIVSAFFEKNYITTYISIGLFILLSVIIYKTRFGLRLRACGENPAAADSLGVNVYRIRYAGMAFSGALAGVGGFVFALTAANCTSTGDVSGFGFLALAVMIFGNWKPLNAFGASLLFGFLKCIAAAYSSVDLNGDGVCALADIGISNNFYRILPFIATLVVLVFTSEKSKAPKASGIPYYKSTG